MALFRTDFFSEALGMHTSANITIPQGAVNAKTPVVYLLHGLSDNCSNWLRLTSVERYANKHGVALVIPEVQRSFYTDMKYGVNYFSYINRELIEFTGAMFGLPTTKEMTYVAGLSMGGFGAMKCALTRPEQYNAVAAFSAVCNIEDLIDKKMTAANDKELTAIFGDSIPSNSKLDLLAQKAGKSAPRVFMTCGTEDVLYPQNIWLREKYKEAGLDVEFHEWKENHTWEFWDESVKMALDFFFLNK